MGQKTDHRLIGQPSWISFSPCRLGEHTNTLAGESYDRKVTWCTLPHEGRLREEDLDGLGQDKLNYIRRAVAK
jgi:hypothetical protein